MLAYERCFCLPHLHRHPPARHKQHRRRASRRASRRVGRLNNSNCNRNSDSWKFQIYTCYASRGNWIDVDVDTGVETDTDSDSDANADADSPQQTQAQAQAQPSTEDKDDENEIEGQNDDLETCVEYILQIVEEEVTRLDGDSRRVVLGGFGQGMAVAIAALLAARRRLGGFVGVSGWVPFSESVEGLGGRGQGRLAKDEARMGGSGVDGVEVDSEADSLLETPVLLSYLEDDPCVDIQTGLTAYETLNRLGFVKVVRDARPGSQQGENWLLDATLLDIIVGFLAEVFGHEGSISALS
ncbi:hypothetical protein CNMCM5878_008059 [Aspergillus fumigatiaffinis]|nr:hypothetical protein CNMCM5878_008059 [Aspergillus fumigatiaffinis]